MGIFKNTLPMYEGDSIIRPGLTEAFAKSIEPSAPAPVRSEPVIALGELARIDREAHRMRAEAVAALMSGGWKRLVAFVKGDGKSAEEQYLAEAKDLPDLELRQRELARSNRFRMPLRRPSYI